MEEVSGFAKDGSLVIKLKGRIDSNNAGEAGEEMTKLQAENPDLGVILDAGELEYISSAGLRDILHLRKTVPDTRIVNASNEVYEIFEMTGFTEMMPIEKSYRTLSIDGCEAIGQGANGKVYRLDPDTIIKVYFNPDSLPDIRRERELARKAFILGIPTAIPYDVVRVGETYGSVFELLNAKNFAQLLEENPEKEDDYIDMYVDLLKKIHSTEVKPGDMPDMKAVAVGWAEFLKDYLPADRSARLIELMKAVPERQTMIHGDYHFKNIMMQNGEPLLIDMDTLSCGHPVFELASMYLGFVGFGEHDHTITEKFMGLPYETCCRIWQKALRLYLGAEDEKEVRLTEQKAATIGYTRLMRRTIRRNGLQTEEGKEIIERCGKHLEESLKVLDTLAF